jgi:dCMP deaminase
MDTTHERIDIHTYFLILAKAAAMRATCPRRAVGTVLVQGGRILSSGYNGSLPGYDHCTDVGCMLVDGHCIRTIHSEANAEAVCPGTADTAYCTDYPCLSCLKLLLAHGVTAFYYERNDYPDPLRDHFIEEEGIGYMFHHHPMNHIILEVG